MNNEACKICGSRCSSDGEIRVRGSHRSELIRCNVCGFMFIENPYWLPEAYADPIDVTDTGHVARNTGMSELVSAFISGYLNTSAQFVDYGSGFGLFVRMMRDKGFDFRWQDAYAKNLFARGFEFQNHSKVELVTAFEVFEHLTDPKSTLTEMSALSDTILFSTLLVPAPVPKIDQWWYYGTAHGQHVAFYTQSSLENLGRIFGYELISDGNSFHLFHRRKIAKRCLKNVQSRWFRILIRKFRPQRSLSQDDYEYVQSIACPK